MARGCPGGDNPAKAVAPGGNGSGGLGRGGRRLLAPPTLAAGARFALLAARGLFLLLALLVAILRRLGTIDQLEEDHRGGITAAHTGLDDPRVATVPLGEPRGDRVEDPADDLAVGHEGEHLPPRVQVLALGQRDDVIGQPTHRLGLGLGGLDALVAEQPHQQVAEHRPPVLGQPAELVAVDAMPHRSPPVLLPRPSAPSTLGSIRMPSDSPSAASAVLISSIDFSPRFLTSARSASVFCTRSATRFSSAPLSALMARAGRASSSSVLPSASRRYASPAPVSVSSSSSGPAVASGEKWSRRNVEARVTASSGLIAPLVHTSSTSFS